MRRFVASMSALAGLGVLLGGIILWRKLGCPNYATTRPYDREPY